jgi:hypothetical protein
MVHDVVLDLVIESEARRAHDTALAQLGADGDAYSEFVGVIRQDIAGHVSVTKTYTFDRVQLTLFLPKLSTQASRLVGVTLHGRATLVTRDAGGRIVSTQTQSYSKSWGLAGVVPPGQGDVIGNDYSDLVVA